MVLHCSCASFYSCCCCCLCFVWCCCSMLTGVAIQVSSTPLPRAVPLTPGAAAAATAEREGAGGTSSAASSADAKDRQGSKWEEQQRQKFAAAAAEKKDRTPVHAYHHPDVPPSPTAAAAAAGTAGVGYAKAGGGPSSSNSRWSDNVTVPEGVAGASAAASPASADRSWRASYASSLYCLLPAWLLRFRGPAYSPLGDDASATAASTTPAASSSCCSSSSRAVAAAGGSGTATGRGGGGENPIGDAPFSTVCLHCHKAVVTTIAFKMSCFGICLCLLCPLLLGWPGLCLSPFLYVALKDAVHTCPQCRNVIHRQSRISIPFFGMRDEVVTVKCGNCAMVLSRRYLLLFAALLLLITLFYILRVGLLGNSLDVATKGPPAYMSWKQFYEQCGQRSQLGNSLKAAANFRESFAGKTVEWKGLVKQVKDDFFSSNVLMVVMSPTITLSGAAGGGGGQSSPTADEGDSSSDSGGDESSSSELKVKSEAEAGTVRQKRENDDSSSSRSSTHTSGNEDEEDLEEEAKALQGDGADLALAFKGSELIEKVEKLEPGDRIQFEATLVTLGRRGKPSLGRLWDVSLVEKRETREARLQEWRAKQVERQHLLQRLLLPFVGSPFSDFGFDPISSLFRSSGGTGGTGVMVIRRQIITPGSSFSVISSSSSSDDEPGMGIPSLFGGAGSISVGGLNSRGHEEDEGEKHHGAGRDGGRHSMFHLEDDEEEYMKGPLVKLIHQQQERTFSSQGVPAWIESSGDDVDNDMHWMHAGPAENPRGNSGLYFSAFDNEDEEHQHDIETGKAHEAAATAFGGAETVNGKKMKSHESHESAVGDTAASAPEADPTLAALKLAVERQRERRAQQGEEQQQQERQQHPHPEPRKQPQDGKQRPVQHEKQQASALKEKEQEEGAKRSPQDRAPSQRKYGHMHAAGDYEKHSGATQRNTGPVLAASVAAASGMHHQQEQPRTQTQDVQGKQEHAAYETKASGDGVDAARVEYVEQQQPGAVLEGRSAETRAAETK